MSEQNEPPKNKQLNFNSFLSMVLLGALIWVGTSIQAGNEKLSKLSERMVAIESINGTKVEQLNRIEVQLNHQQSQINDMAVQLERIKNNRP